jgi:hypothetical protein
MQFPVVLIVIKNQMEINYKDEQLKHLLRDAQISIRRSLHRKITNAETHTHPVKFRRYGTLSPGVSPMVGSESKTVCHAAFMLSD